MKWVRLHSEFVKKLLSSHIHAIHELQYTNLVASNVLPFFEMVEQISASEFWLP
jgi:hypothetical protein